MLLIDGFAVIVNVALLDNGPPAPLRTCTVNVPPLFSVTGATTCPVVFVLNTPLLTVQGAHDGPLITTCTLSGLKPLPLMVRLKLPVPRLVGEMLFITTEFTVSVWLLESAPDAPLRTWKVKLPVFTEIDWRHHLTARLRRQAHCWVPCKAHNLVH